MDITVNYITLFNTSCKILKVFFSDSVVFHLRITFTTKDPTFFFDIFDIHYLMTPS